MSTGPTINLKAERLNRGYSLRQAQAATGVPEQSIRRAEAGESITPRYAYKLATHYGYKVTDIWPVDAPSPSPAQSEAA